jgi:sulfane dehydrogenase subunit SoxC
MSDIDDKVNPQLRDAPQVAGGGLLDRRLFLRGGAALVGLTIAGSTGSRADTAQAGSATSNGELANPQWMHEAGAPFSSYGQPSPHESDVIRWVSANQAAPGNGVAWCPLHRLEGTITPNGLHFERHHNGVPQIDPEKHRLLIHGLVDRPLFFTMADLLRYPQHSQQMFIECGGNSNAAWNREPLQASVSYIHGLVSCSEWTGVPLALLLRESALRVDAKWLVAEGADAFAMHISIPIEKAMDDAILALYQNGERLRPENGYPLRLILPGWEGVHSVKWLRRLKAVSAPVMARNETARYSELLKTGKARQFTFPIGVKSLITSPHMGSPLQGPGYYQVSGLAWSGRGRITGVEVSADGGQSWADAELQKPIAPRCFTRFRIPWRWDGSPALLQSRATDESGDRQPTRDVLVAARGRHGYFHYNAIVSWAVDADGLLSHVY